MKPITREDKYKDFVKVCESPTLWTWIIAIIIFPLFFECIRIYKLHRKLEKLGDREKWIYQQALNDSMELVNLNSGAAYRYGRVCSYRFDIPKGIRNENDYSAFVFGKR